ncbi:hypothetical protein SD72_06530 [Leucobacter komagatae]|uniref:Uncharacterized protein n=1 Tax=Leucobacter komagatae TaxID=55969 RepID=A0A0D0IP54_9MICO|nr:hypothetical protein SD72_06530 [Leucobacter komagatae]
MGPLAPGATARRGSRFHRRSGDRHHRAASTLVRAVAQRRTRRRTAEGAIVCHGGGRLARRAGVAARAYPIHSLVLP